jgi:hypothetical protein
MNPFGKWLAEIGLEHHGAVFASNESHFDVIRNADVLHPARPPQSPLRTWPPEHRKTRIV